MRVEIGAGGGAQPGWLAVDLNPDHADVIADGRALPFQSGTVDAMRCVDIIEHISYHWTDDALAEWARVLRPGGELFVQCPDAAMIMRWFTNADIRLQTWEKRQPCTLLWGAQWRLLGGHADGVYADEAGWDWNAHHSLWSDESLRDALAPWFDVRSCITNPFPNLQAWAIRR